MRRGSFTQNTTAQPPQPRWTHIAVTWDRTMVRTYVDGVQVGADARSGYFYEVGDYFSIGGCPDPVHADKTFVGEIDDVSVFHHALGPDEIAAFYAGHGTYRRNTGYPQWQWAQYQVSAFDQSGQFSVIPPPADTRYAGTGYAYGVDSTGTIVGTQMLSNGTFSAVMYRPAEGYTNLNELLSVPNDWNLYTATAVSEAGLILGGGAHAGRPTVFRLNIHTHEIIDVAENLPLPYSTPGLYNPSGGAMNSNGDIVFRLHASWNPWMPERAFMYTDDTGLTDLNDLIDPAAGWVVENATGINDARVITGYARNVSTGVRRAYKLPFSMPQALASNSSLSPTPILDCVAYLDDGQRYAVLGYHNPNSFNVHIEEGADNQIALDGAPASRWPLAPTWFIPGTVVGAVVVPFSIGSTVVWNIEDSSVDTTSAAACQMETTPAGLAAVGGATRSSSSGAGYASGDTGRPRVPIGGRRCRHGSCADIGRRARRSGTDAARDRTTRRRCAPCRIFGRRRWRCAVRDSDCDPGRPRWGRATPEPDLQLASRRRGDGARVGHRWIVEDHTLPANARAGLSRGDAHGPARRCAVNPVRRIR